MFLKISIGVGSAKRMELIPINWVKDFNLIAFMNNGLSRYKNKTFTVFFSNDISAEPDFMLRVLDKFNSKRNACYKAKLLRLFDTLEAGRLHLRYPRVEIDGHAENGNDLMNISGSDCEDIEDILQMNNDDDDLIVEWECIPRPIKN